MAGGGEGRLKFRRLFYSHQTKIAIHYDATSAVSFFLVRGLEPAIGNLDADGFSTNNLHRQTYIFLVPWL